MGVKSEISWKRRGEDGVRREVYARRANFIWSFFVRERRFDCWEPLKQPPLEDWIELLDAVRRRVQRRLLQPDDEERLRRTIVERFPEAKV